MKKEQIVALLQCLGSDAAKKQDRTGWVIAHCPLGPWKHGGHDKSPSFGVRLKDGFCHCWSCGFGGSPNDLIGTMKAEHAMKKAGPFDFPMADKIADDAAMDIDYNVIGIEEMLFGQSNKKPIHEFPLWFRDSFKPASDIPWAADYLHSRGVPEQFWSHYDLRADTGQKRVCIPVYDFKDRLVGMHGRAVEDANPMRYRMYLHDGENNPICWLGEHWIDFERPVVWVEGYFDLLAVARVYENVVSPLFANPSLDKMDRMGDSFEIITLFDKGQGGDHGRARVKKWAGKRLVTHLKPPAHRKDPGVMTNAELVELLGDKVTLRKKLVT